MRKRQIQRTGKPYAKNPSRPSRPNLILASITGCWRQMRRRDWPQKLEFFGSWRPHSVAINFCHMRLQMRVGRLAKPLCILLGSTEPGRGNQQPTAKKRAAFG